MSNTLQAKACGPQPHTGVRWELVRVMYSNTQLDIPSKVHLSKRYLCSSNTVYSPIEQEVGHSTGPLGLPENSLLWDRLHVAVVDTEPPPTPRVTNITCIVSSHRGLAMMVDHWGVCYYNNTFLRDW